MIRMLGDSDSVSEQTLSFVPPNQRMQPTAYRAAFQVVWRLRRVSGWSTLAGSCVRPAAWRFGNRYLPAV